MVEGLDGIKYIYYNGYIVKDLKLVVMYFINVLECIFGMIEKWEKENVELLKDILVLQEIVVVIWFKEGEIKKLGEEFVILNWKIQFIFKLVGWYENVEGKEMGVEEQRFVSGSDVILDLLWQVKYVLFMEIVNLVRELKKIF